MNKVTQEQIDRIITNGKVVVSKLGEKTTVVTFTTKEGFEMIASSACVDKSNYDQALGEHICMKKIEDNLWAYEGYCLQKDLFYNEKDSGDKGLTAKERVNLELADIIHKLGKLTTFITSAKFEHISLASRRFLLDQRRVMEEYSSILSCRLSIWEDIK